MTGPMNAKSPSLIFSLVLGTMSLPESAPLVFLGSLVYVIIPLHPVGESRCRNLYMVLAISVSNMLHTKVSEVFVVNFNYVSDLMARLPY